MTNLTIVDVLHQLVQYESVGVKAVAIFVVLFVVAQKLWMMYRTEKFAKVK